MQAKRLPHQPVWITDADALSALVFSWKQCETLFVDTEFQREKTFYPILALIQIFDGEQVYFIEPGATKLSQPFIKLIADPGVRKVFHSASEDCEVLYRHLNVRIEGLWDTQIAAAFVKLGLNLGYAALIEKYCEISLEKGIARSDWLQRPLTAEQQQYAADDVVYLAQAYHVLLQTLSSNPNYLNWISQDSEQLASRVEELDDLDRSMNDIKNAWRLNPSQLQRLKSILYWRDCQARALDQPKTFLLRNEQVLSLAQKGLIHDDKLPHLDGWHPVARRKYSVDLVNCLQQLEQDKEQLLPIEPPLSPAFWQQFTRPMQQARDVIIDVAEAHSLDPDLLCSKKLLRGYVKNLLGKKQQWPRSWTQWRENLLAEKLKNIFTQ